MPVLAFNKGCTQILPQLLLCYVFYRLKSAGLRGDRTAPVTLVYGLVGSGVELSR
jgi:hypothetical protein